MLAAPDPRDVIWPNVTREARGERLRRLATTAALGVLLVVWSGFVSAILSLANLKELEVVFPALRRLDESTYFTRSAAARLPTVIQLGLFNLLPVLFELAARAYAGQKSSFEVQRSVLDRYFYFQLVNVFMTIFSARARRAVRAREEADKIGGLLSETLPQVARVPHAAHRRQDALRSRRELARPTAIARTWARKLVPYRPHTPPAQAAVGRARRAPVRPRAPGLLARARHLPDLRGHRAARHAGRLHKRELVERPRWRVQAQAALLLTWQPPPRAAG